jgi:phosphomannomutase / phosphoglucomutase
MTSRISSTLFREYDIRGVVDRDMTDEAVHLVGKALGTMVRKAGGSKVVVGRDCRLSGGRFAEMMITGLNATGVDVIDVGVVPTPLTYFAACTLDVDGLCMITGSHNPAEYNGLKVGVGKTTLHGAGIQELRRMVDSEKFIHGKGTTRVHDIVTPYKEYVRQNLSFGPRKLKVVVDAGNGTGGVVAVPIFKALGIEVVPLFVEMDGRFPNHHPDPTVEENLEQLKKKVLEVKADVGIAYDGDADRVGAVDERGGVLWGDQLMILFSRDVLAERPGAAIVSEVKCSQTLYDDIEKHGGRAIMWKAGHSLIKSKMKEEHALLAGEMSGHIFFRHRYFGFDDGIYSAARLLELVARDGRPLSRMLDGVPRTYASPEIRFDFPEEKKFRAVELAKERLRKHGKTIEVDGVRVILDGGWGLVRASNTQPLLVLRWEATSEARLREIQRLIEGTVQEIRKELA